MTWSFGFLLTYAWITASSKALWNDEPPPWRVELPEPDPPPLLPQAASTVARPTATASTRGRFRVAITDFLRAGGRGTRGCATPRSVRMGDRSKFTLRWTGREPNGNCRLLECAVRGV